MSLMSAPLLQLDAPLAQSIVERTMAIIGANVNVMDHRGIVIASGDPARIGTLHEGAALVLAQGRTVEIDHALAGRLHDARPGINLPLRAEGRVVGVVGLSGEPGAIRHYAELLRMAAETMLEQARLSRLLARDARLREELVLQLAGVVPAEGAGVGELARRLGVDPELPRVVLVIVLDAAGRDIDTLLAEQQALLARLQQADPGVLAAAASLGELVVLMPARDQRGQHSPAAQRRRAELLCRQCPPGLPLAMALGGDFAGPEGPAKSYRSAKATLRLARRTVRIDASAPAGGPPPGLHHYADVSLAVLLAELDRGWQTDALRRPAVALRAGDRHGVLRATLHAWFAQRMNTAATARALGVHRNTLDHRLRRIEALTGLALDAMDGALQLYLALQLAEAAEEL